MRRRSRSSDALKTTRSVLSGILDDLGIANKIEQHRIWLVWEDAVGEQIAKNAIPARIRNNVLEIKVAHAVWMQQLQLLKPRLIEQINKHLGDTPITDLYFRRGQVAPEVKPEAKPARVLPELDTKELEGIHQLTRNIADDEVRAALESLLAKHRQLDKLAKMVHSQQ
jgi:hypothetical protein